MKAERCSGIVIVISMLSVSGCANYEVFRSNVLQPQVLPAGSRVLICEASPGFDEYHVKKFSAELDTPGIEIISVPESDYKGLASHSVAKNLINRFSPDATFIVLSYTRWRYYNEVDKAQLDQAAISNAIRMDNMRSPGNYIVKYFRNKHIYTSYDVYQYNKEGKYIGHRLFGKELPDSTQVDLSYDAIGELVTWLESHLSTTQP